LVELLVVIAIIALLMSILMPALARTRKQANLVLDQSNLKQWGICFAGYAGDWDSKFLQGWHEADPGPRAVDYWMDGLRPYYGNEGDLRLCPMATKPGSETGQGPWGGIRPDATFFAWGVFPEIDQCGQASSAWECAIACDYGSYGNNSYICDPPPKAKVIQGHPTTNNWRTTDIRDAAYVPVIGDEQWIDCWPHHADEPPEYSGQYWQTDHAWSMLRICINRHDGYVNWCFADWSVRKVGLKQLWKLKWHRTFDFDQGPTDWPDWMKAFRE